MATSEVEICNLALIKIGHETISDLTQETKASRMCARLYPKLRDATLRAHPWNFARKRAQLVASSEAPAFGYAYAYAKPLDYLRIVTPEDPRTDFTFESGFFLTNVSPFRIKYIWQVTNPNEFDSLFIDTLATRVAADLAMSLAQSAEMVDAMWSVYRDRLAEARHLDAQEGNGPEFTDDTGWLEQRFADGDVYRPITVIS